MENKKYSLEFIDENNSVKLCNGINFANNSKLIEYFKNERYKKEDCSFVFKESVETSLSDLLKIKVNIESIGYFLINFKNNEENNEKCLELIYKVKELKGDSNFDLENQCLKIGKVIKIISEYNVAFVVFILEKNVPNDYIDFKKTPFDFPFIFIDDFQKEKLVKQAQHKNAVLNFMIEAPFFNVDYLFNLLFSFFASFSLHTSVSLFSNNNWKGVLFIILSLALICILNYCLFLIFYQENKKNLKGHKIIMALYLCFGTGVGLIVSILVSQYYLNISYNGLLVFIDVFAYILSIGSIFTSKIVKFFKKT